MARKQQIQIQESIETEEQFNDFMDSNAAIITCIEIYSQFAGPSTAMTGTLRKIKLEIGGDKIVLAKAECDDIESLERFRYKSEPIFFFVRNCQVISVIFGADAIALVDTAQQEVDALNNGLTRPGYSFLQRHPTEIEYAEAQEAEEKEDLARSAAALASREAARKRRVCERRAEAVPHLNFILFWPQNHQAHYDLYEKWSTVGVSVLGKENLYLTEEVMMEVAYESDLELNAAATHELLSGEALAICFKLDLGDSDTDFVDLMRTVLYEEQLPPDEQGVAKTPFSKYSSISKPPEQVRIERFEALVQKKRDEKEERRRLRSEAARMAREAEEQRVRDEQQRQEEARIARLQAGILETPPDATEVSEPTETENEENAELVAEEHAVEKLAAEDLPVEELVDEEERNIEPEVTQNVEEESEEEPELVFPGLAEGEEEAYIPPGGLFVPGLYSPPNHLARANGLTILFRNIVARYTTIESEKLPPHVLLMFKASRRHEVTEVAEQFPDQILQVGMFAGDDPYTAEHIAYTVREYDKMQRILHPQEYLALMVSEEKNVPLLSLAALNPEYVSLDRAAGEAECAAMFPVGYGDNHEPDVDEALDELAEEDPNKVDPDALDELDEPKEQDEPNESGSPKDPDVPNEPGVTEEPGLSNEPGDTSHPTVPGGSDQPGLSNEPGVPNESGDPGHPTEPGGHNESSGANDLNKLDEPGLPNELDKPNDLNATDQIEMDKVKVSGEPNEPSEPAKIDETDKRSDTNELGTRDVQDDAGEPNKPADDTGDKGEIEQEAEA